MHIKAFSKTFLLVLIAATAISAQTRHPLKLDDLARFRNVGDPQVSPDGKVDRLHRLDHRRERRQRAARTSGWLDMTGRTIGKSLSATTAKAAPRWSPDGKYLCVHFFAFIGQTRRARQSDLAARSQRRRSLSTH